MYQAFDRWLATDTWHTSHPNDDARFYQALATVVTHDSFNADDMGTYFRTAKDVSRDDADDDHFNYVIDKRVTQADAVREYLGVTGGLNL